MNCPSCATPQSRVNETTQVGSFVVRKRHCRCGARWTTEERVSKGSIRTSIPPPVPISTPPIGTNSLGGVGGGLPGDPVRILSDLPSVPRSSPDPVAPDPSIPSPFRSPTRPFPPGAATLPFLSVYDAYPRKHRKLPAAAVWQELASSYQGGEQALAEAILKRFREGFLRRPPYNGDIKHVPTLETFLSARSWEDGADRPWVANSATMPWEEPPEIRRAREAVQSDPRSAAEVLEDLRQLRGKK